MTCRYKYYCGYLIRSRNCLPFVNAWVHLRNFNGVCCSSFLVFCVVFCALSSLRVDVCGRFSVLCFVLCLRSVSMSVEGFLCCVLYFVFAPCRCLWKILVFYVVFYALSSLRVDVCGWFSVLCFVLCFRSVWMSVEGSLSCVLCFVFAPCRCM